MAAFHVNSEISTLRKVLVHSPDAGIERITPRRSQELLFDDIVHLDQMRKEHAVFVEVLNSFLGEENVFEVGNLILEAIRSTDEGRDELVDLISDFEELPQTFKRELAALPDDELTSTLITGYCPSTNTILFDPIPNFVFTRDIAVAVKDHIVITKAAKEARHRENLLSRFFFRYHPMFREHNDDGRIINLNIIDEFPPSRKGERVSIEGGDMMVLNKDYLLIGCSERSTRYAFDSLKEALFAKGAIDNVVMVQIPVDRSYMHIDTVFTQIDHSDMLSFKPIVVDGLSSYVEVHTSNGLRRHYPAMREFMLAEIHPDMQFIFSGDGISPYQEREQWTDACNLLAIRPGVAIGYDRNKYTERSLRNCGYTILPALEYLSALESDPELSSRLEKTIISLPSGELSRARGGSHCMSCPVERDMLE